MAEIEQAMFVLPKKRNGKKTNTVVGHVDHIITIQGTAESNLPLKYKNDLSPVTEHGFNGTIHSTMEGLKSNLKINLPIINDTEESNEATNDRISDNIHSKESYQTFTTTYKHREIVDLSPIYENSSDGYSSHGDLRENNDNDLQKSKLLYSDHIDSSMLTLNSLSESSFEMGSQSDNPNNIIKKKKQANVQEMIENDTNDYEITTLRVDSDESLSPERSLESSKDNYLTMTGTIKRGKKKGQNVDVKLNVSREELEFIEAAIVAEEYNKMDISKCSMHNGPHIFLFSLLCIPFVACISAAYSFYIGTQAWYNIFTHINEEFSCIKKLFWSPVVILSYPFLIVIFTICLGLYAGIVQLTFSRANWWKDVCDFEKGFYGWLCSTLNMSECSPYEVVVLMDIKPF